MHVGATHVSDNFSRVLVHNFYEGVVVHLMEGLVVPDLNDTKCDLAHRNTTSNKRVAISKNNQQLKKPRPGMYYTILNDCFDRVKRKTTPLHIYRPEPPRLLARVALFTHSHPLQI